MAAQAIFQAHSKRHPAESLNRTALFVVLDAQKHTHFTTVSKIDTELQVTTTPVLSTRGPRAGLPLKSGKTTTQARYNTVATRIVLARMHPYSSYNLLTDRKWMIDRAKFSPGMGQAGFERKVEAVAAKMARARHSSIKFFLSSWNPIISGLIAALGRRRIPGGAQGDTEIDTTIAHVEPAKPGATTFQCGVENKIGMSGQYPNLDLKRNLYAHQHLAPALQGAIDREFESKMLEANKRGWLEDSPKLRALGFEVNV